MGLTILTAYPLSRKHFPGQRAIMFIFVLTMFFSGGMIPLYLLLNDMKLLNTMASLIFPTFLSVYNLIIMKNFYLSIPPELEESAHIDGCTNFGILLKIFVPLSMPAVMTITLFDAVGHWNAFFNAMMYITDMKRQPLQIFLRNIVLDIVSGASNEEKIFLQFDMQSVKSATVILSTLPIVIIYPFISKHFTKGVIVGAVKG
jgi:putative aldouronate transport system permease protein